MDLKEILSRLNKFEIKIRKTVNNRMHGNFSSVFKGSGLEFSDLRTYQYGDDIRAIDWISTAKGHGAYVKLFKAEKEQTVFFVLDISASQQVGSGQNQKIQTAKEVCGVLALAAIKESSQVGVLAFSDQKELYIKPEGGTKQAYKIISSIFRVQTQSLKTSLSEAILFTLNILKRKSLVILISDFLDNNYENNLKALARKHDLILLEIFHEREIEIPNIGIIPIYNQETGNVKWINSASNDFIYEWKKTHREKQKFIADFCRKENATLLSIVAGKDFVNDLITLFRLRK